MRNTKGIVETVEYRNVNYTDMPKVLYRIIKAGFAFDDICKNRIDGCHYDVMAQRTRKVGA